MDRGKLPGEAPAQRQLVPFAASEPDRPSNLPHRNTDPSSLRGKWRLFRASIFAPESPLGSNPAAGGRIGLTLLHEPSDPRIDLIFVHGLRGGSRKTWCSNVNDESTFWPQEWLPNEPGFRNVRIHSFGYDSDWSLRQQSPLTILDFAQALLADISISPHLNKNRKTPILFMAHSMGGLVVKKAYLLAKSDPLYKEIAERTDTMHFLGTCHRGSNSTVYLETFLSLNLPLNTKAYVKELLPDSQTVREINSEFRHVCGTVNLWSFWESVPTAGVFIVEKSSAVLDVPREHVQYLPADHRHLCKFSTPDDPSYIILRQALLYSVRELESTDASRQEEKYASDMSLISKALGEAERPRRELSSVLTRLHHGSCQWITDSNSFRDWTSFGDDTEVDPLDPTPQNEHARVLWLSGPPGSGKSVAAGHIIDFLQQHNFDCSYFFIKSNAQVSLTRLLLSLAFQMAESNYDIRLACLAMIEKGGVNLEDHSVIWNNLFSSRILKFAFCQPQFWLIDGLDELPSRPLSSLIQMVGKIEASIPLRICITSRPHVPIQLRFQEEGIKLSQIHTGKTGSMGDIAAFVDSKFKLRLDDDAQREELIPDIVRKSRGIFLWASLIIDRLETAYSVEDMKDALQQAPLEMIGMYGKILDKIKASLSASLAKCILEWVVCAPRPLKTEELRKIVFLDIKQTLVARSTALNAIFTEICGNFIAVDSQGCVQLMHQTVKEFLSSEDSEFYVDERTAHEKHAIVCLTHLNVERSSSGPTRRRPVSPAPNRQDDSVFDDYASANFSYHLAHSHSANPSLFGLLGTFFNGGVLSWVERVAQTGKLGPILTAVQNLRPYLTRQLDRSPPFDSQYKRVKEWLDDLTRLVTIFGPNLIDSPSSIHLMIPPLCPTSSMIYQTFAKRSRSRVICDSNEQWDERVAILLFSSAAKDVSVSDQYAAVGLGDGTIRVFNQSTFGRVATLKHGKPLSKVAFGNITNTLASCSYNLLILWSSDFTEKWRAAVTGVMGLCFSPDDSFVFVSLRDAERTVVAFQTCDGSEVSAFSTWGYGFDCDIDSDGNTPGSKRYVPEVVRLSPLLGLAALAYRVSHVTISTLDEHDGLSKMTTFKKAGSEHLSHAPQVLDITFSPAIDSDMMAISYQDGDIVTVDIDYWSARQRDSYKLHASVLASSPDGRTLAAGDNEGGVCLFAFDTLCILHRISAVEEGVKRIFFASNSLRLFDMRMQSCNVWEPPTLVRHNSMDDNTSTDSTEPDTQAAVAVPNILATRPFENSKTVTAMVTANSDEFILCGHEDGSMAVHNLNKGRVVLSTQFHMAGIRHLAWDSNLGVLMSVEFHGSWETRRFAFPSSGPSAGEETLMEMKANNPVLQVLVRENSSSFSALLTTTNGEELVQDGKVISSSYALGTARWIQHPTDANRLLLVGYGRVHLFHWVSLRRETPEQGIQLVIPGENVEKPLPDLWHSICGLRFLVQTELTQKDTKTRFITIDVSRILPSTTSISAAVTTLDIHVKRILKIDRSSIYFLGRNSWICSLSTNDAILRDDGPNVATMKRLQLAVELERRRRVPTSQRRGRMAQPKRRSSLGVPDGGSRSLTSSGKYYTRHFFVPPYWRTPDESIIEIVPDRSCVGLAYRDEFIVFTGFLDGGEKVGFTNSERI